MGLYEFGRFTLNPVDHKLRADGVPVPLGPTDFRLLLMLVENAGATVAKDVLMSVLGGRAARDNVLHVHISALRKTLGDGCIVSQQGRGYRFVSPVRWTEPHLGNLSLPWAGNGTVGPARPIGRAEQLRIVAELLAHGRLVTLTGPGGVGKTTLALHAANEASSRFGDGVWLVELANLNDQDLLPVTVASALGVKVGINATALDTLSRYLAPTSLLIVLDNCEHVIAAAARISETLLAAAPCVKVLATSREALSCSGEHVLEVPPLDVPHEGTVPPDAMRSMAAVKMFIERAEEANANLRIDDLELALVARICRRVDGLPLAIEMVAGWAGLLGLETLDAKLDGSLKSWLRARSTAPTRHSTLRATLEWSYALLSAAEQTVVCRLAVFAGGFTMDAAEAVAGDDTIPKDQIFEHVANLARKSMISVVHGALGHRYRLLETTRAFMLERLTASGEDHATRKRHASYVLSFLEQANLEWETTSDAHWLERYGPVLNDLRAALNWAVREESDDAVALAGMSWPLWRELSHGAEGRTQLAAAATRLRASTAPALEARLRRGLGALLLNAAATEAARDEIERAVILYRKLGDCSHLGSALTVLGYALFVLGRVEEAKQTIQEALRLLEPTGWLRTLAVAYSIQMCIETTRGSFAAARVAEEKSTRLCEMAGADHTALIVAGNLVQLHLESGDLDGAISTGRGVMVRLDSSRHSDVRGFVLGFLAAAHTARGDLDEALTAAREAAPLLRDEGTLFWLFDHLALRCVLSGRTMDAALIIGYADAVYLKVGRTREPMGRRAVERLRDLLHGTLPEDEIVRFREMGAQLTQDQAMALALGV